jgi:hypothetical protein
MIIALVFVLLFSRVSVTTPALSALQMRQPLTGPGPVDKEMLPVFTAPPVSAGTALLACAIIGPIGAPREVTPQVVER